MVFCKVGKRQNHPANALDRPADAPIVVYCQLMTFLREGECTAGELVHTSGLGTANVSKHPRILLAAGFASRRQSGLFVYYQLAGDHVFQLCDLMCNQLKIETATARAAFSGTVGGAAVPKIARARSGGRGRGSDA